jgi:hypothetical protein
VIVRYCAEFGSSLPYDGIENDEGTEFLRYPGKNVATAVGELLRRIGYEADDPMDAGDHGWEFEVRVKGYRKGRPKGGRFWCTVTLIDRHVMVFDNPSWWDKFLERHPALYLEALRALGREMAADPLFSEVQWSLLDDTPAASQPVED